MAFSKNRRLADLVSSAGEVSSFVDASVTHADLHTSMDLTGKTVTVANASTGDSDTTAANTAFVQQEIAALVDSSPGTLNTLNELAAALGDDANFSTTVTNSIATKLPLAGGTLTGDLILGDSVQIEFGSASGGDTNIRHDGNNTKFSHTGTGGLYIGADLFAIQNAAHNENYLTAAANGSVQLYYDNSLKLLTSSTGINLPLDGESIKFGANSEIILTHEHDIGLALQGALKLYNNNTDDTNKEGHLLARQYDSGTETEGFQILQYFANSSGNRIDVGGASSQYNAATEINFYTAADTTTRTGTTRMTIDSSGRVGIGTTSMGAPLHITNATPVLRFTDSDTSRNSQIVGVDGNLRLDADNDNQQSSTNISFRTDGTERARLDDAGRLLLNSTSTSFNDNLYINGSGYAVSGWRVGSTATYVGKMHNNSGKLSLETDATRDIQFGSATNPDTIFIDTSDRRVGIGNANTTPVTTLDVKNSGDSAYTGGLLIRTGTSTTEATSLYHDNNSATTTVLANRYDNAGAAIKLILRASSGSPVTALTALGSGNVLVGPGTDRGRKFVVEGTGDLMALYSTNAGSGGAQFDLIHDSASYADGDSVGIINFSTDDRQLGSIKAVGAVSGERGVVHIGVRKSSSEYNHNAMRLHNGGDEVLLDIYSPSGSNRGAGYFRFKTDGASTEESVAQIYMEQGSGDGAARKSNMYFQVADNGSPSTAMTIENNKYVSTATNLNVSTSSAASNAKLNVAGGIRFTHSPASAAGLNVTTQVSINNTSSNLVASNLYYKSFFINFYHNNGHSQCFFVANGGGGIGYNFTGLVPGESTVITGTGIDQTFTTIGSSPNTFRVQLTSGGGQLYITRSNGTGSFQVSIQVLTGG